LRPNVKKTFYIETFGCQMNVHDSEKVCGTLISRGYQPVERPDQAGLVLYNTCSIRDKAEQKVFSRLSNFKRQRTAGQVFGVLGCVAQHQGEEIFAQAPHVNLVCGSASYNELPELLRRLEAGESRVTGLSLDTDETFDTPLTRRDNPYRAYITIIEGCDKHCAYCVVPFTRGPERSRTSESVLAEAGRLAASGYTEIQLLGQNVNSYRDPSPSGWNFAQLLAAVGRVPGIRRVRFTTSHPRDFTPEIVEAIEANEVLCNHVHLPVQSGSTRVLERMQRDYTRDDYLRRIERLQAACRPIALSTDIIVGFPGETEEDFEQTLSLLDEVGYDSVFSFKYSPRANTPAVAYEDAVPEEEKSRRLAILQEMQRRIQERRNAAFVGREEEVLVEGRREKFQQWIGRTTQNRVLNFSDPRRIGGGEDLHGAYGRVRVAASGPNSLVGELIARTSAPAFQGFRILQ
jgi:tRNA-2-methylthio-N6-dimethylallyladenosine synthase